MLQGLNATCTIQRRTQAADDVVGGAVISFVDVYTNVKCRISAIRPSYIDVTDQGIETQKIFQVLIWPANYTIYEGDKLVITSPATHDFFNEEFLTISTLIDSIEPADDRRHIELYVNRYERSRSVA